MNILWVEDGGGSLQMNTVVIDLFGNFISKEVFARNYDEDEGPENELPRLFAEHTPHRITVCRSYEDWRILAEEQMVDFDVAILDINLEDRPTEMPPIDVETFDKKAGLYIYHELIRTHRFADDNIAFFTGEKDTLKEFVQLCQASMVMVPAHCFEKKKVDFEKIRAWLTVKAESRYLRLRRGILDGCSYLLAELEDTPEEELSSRFPLFRPADPAREFDLGAYRDRMQHHLFRFEHFLPMCPPEDLSSFYGRFVVDLTSLWDYSPNPEVERSTAEFGGSEVRDLFARSRPKLLGLLQDWSSRDLFADMLTEAEVAFTFLLVGRGWMAWSTDGLAEYEHHLIRLLPEGKTSDELDEWIANDLEKLLEASYNTLSAMVDSSPYRPVDFMELCRQLAERTEAFSPDDRLYVLETMREQGLGLIYQAYWHGLAPTWVDPYTNRTYVSFEIVPIPPTGLHRELGCRLADRTFANLDAVVAL